MVLDKSVFICLQIGCFMGFSITACVIAGAMFICYCIAVAEFGRVIRCKRSHSSYYYPTYDHYGFDAYCYSASKRHNAAVGAGLGSCQLIFAIVEFFIALASSIYCCNAVCCGAPTVGSVSNKVIILIHLLSSKTSTQEIYIKSVFSLVFRVTGKPVF